MTRGHIAVVGASGFLGRNIVAAGVTAGVEIGSVVAPRISGTSGPAIEAADQWERWRPDTFGDLCRALEPFAVVVNAAGMATPDAHGDRSLYEANAVVPAVVARAAATAGVRRLLHLSSAAVQGRLDPLDETTRLSPLSPYAAAKADGERALLDEAAGSGRMPAEVVVFRPISVHGEGRATTRALAHLAATMPVIPVAGRGDRPVPVALVENVAAGVLWAATMAKAPPVVLQPDEGLTTGALLRLFGARRLVPVPPSAVDVALGVAGRVTARSPGWTARLRRVEVLLRGQETRAVALANAGFKPPFAIDRWESLADRLAQRSV